MSIKLFTLFLATLLEIVELHDSEYPFLKDLIRDIVFPKDLERVRNLTEKRTMHSYLYMYTPLLIRMQTTITY